ncbi:MAG: hypothetical protein AAFY74_16635 [Pseudomonadota bacterium]
MDEPVHLPHLDVPRDVLSRRVAHRSGHFIPPSLLDSQFGAFERLDPDKWSSEVDIARPYAEVVARSEAYVRGAMI